MFFRASGGFIPATAARSNLGRGQAASARRITIGGPSKKGSNTKGLNRPIRTFALKVRRTRDERHRRGQPNEPSRQKMAQPFVLSHHTTLCRLSPAVSTATGVKEDHCLFHHSFLSYNRVELQRYCEDRRLRTVADRRKIMRPTSFHCIVRQGAVEACARRAIHS